MSKKKAIIPQFEKIKDNYLRNACVTFYDKYEKVKTHPDTTRDLINTLKDITLLDFSWKWIMDLDVRFLAPMIKVMYILHDEGLFDHEGLDDCRETLMQISKSSFRGEKSNLYRGSLTPYSFFIVKGRRELSGMILVIPNIHKGFHDFFAKYAASIMDYDSGRGTTIFISRFFDGCEKTSFNDFNDETYEKDFRWASALCYLTFDSLKSTKSRDTYNAISSLNAFYSFVQDQLTKEELDKQFKIFRKSDVLSYQHLTDRLREGYKVVNYSVHEDCPKEDKLLLRISKDDADIRSISSVIAIDFTPVENLIVRQVVKECFWFDTTINFKNKIKRYYKMFEFANVISERIGDAKEFKVTIADIINFKRKLSETNKSFSTALGSLAEARRFIIYLFKTGYQEEDNALISLTKSYNVKDSNAYTEYYTKEEIERLIEGFIEKYQTERNERMKKYFLLETYIIELMATTELRKASIFGLRTDCLVKVLNGRGKDEYKIRSKTKTSKGEYLSYNITEHTRKIIDEVLRITDEDREGADEKFKQYLFITKRFQNKTVKPMSESTLENHLHDVCDAKGIKYKKCEGLRNHYQNMVTKFVEDRGLDKINVEALSGHTYKIHEQYYVDKKIEDACRMLYKVEIGDLDLQGQVKDDAEANFNKSSTVIDGCGNCDQSSCTLDGNLDCLMCKHFVSTPSCIPYYKEAIAEIDKKIYDQKLIHEKEFLVSKKKLLVAYLERLISLKEVVQ